MGRTLRMPWDRASAGLGIIAAVQLDSDGGLAFSFSRSPVLNFAACGLWEMLAQTLSRLSPIQAGPLALGTLKLQHWYDWGS